MTQVSVKRVEPIGMQGQTAAAPARRPVDASADFAEYVRVRLEGPVLCYSDRLALLKEAQRRRLGRFEANLVIAQVLHQEGMTQTYEMRPKTGWLGVAVVVGVVQSAIGVGIWWVLG
jgi:hypothetical protein